MKINKKQLASLLFKKSMFGEIIEIPLTPIQFEILKKIWNTVVNQLNNIEHNYDFELLELSSYQKNNSLEITKCKKMKEAIEALVSALDYYHDQDANNNNEINDLYLKIKQKTGIKTHFEPKEIQKMIDISKNDDKNDSILDMYNLDLISLKQMKDLFKGKEMYEKIVRRINN